MTSEPTVGHVHCKGRTFLQRSEAYISDDLLGEPILRRYALFDRRMGHAALPAKASTSGQMSDSFGRQVYQWLLRDPEERVLLRNDRDIRE